MTALHAGFNVGKAIRAPQTAQDLVAGYFQRRQVVTLDLDFQRLVKIEQFGCGEIGLHAHGLAGLRPKGPDHGFLLGGGACRLHGHQHARDVLAAFSRIRVDPISGAGDSVDVIDARLGRGKTLHVSAEAIRFVERGSGHSLQFDLEAPLLEGWNQLGSHRTEQQQRDREQHQRHGQSQAAPLEREVQ